MNRRIITAGMVLAAMGSLVMTARAQSSEKAVKAQGYVSVDAIRRGDKFKVAVSLQVADGYHINAHVPSEEYLVPTTLTLTAPPGIRLSDPIYPAPIERT